MIRSMTISRLAVGTRLAFILTALWVLAACSTAPAPPRESRSVSSPPAVAREPQNASTDSVVQFLLTAAAKDFHAHRPPDPVRFRDVRLGHVISPGGEAQYMLCGEFLPARKGGTPEWTPFATIKTSGYEQWIGGQAAGFCRRPSVIWDEVGDLSAPLQSNLNSLR